jgi:DNA polymerase III sliding clamp (beta) subunit (PCNA family)
MQVKKTELLDALRAIKPAIASKEIIDQSTHFVFQKGEVRSYDDRVSINSEFDYNGPSFAIKADEFFKLISSLTSEKIELDLDGDNKLKLKCGKTKATLNVDYQVKLPDIDLPQDDDWIDLPSDFTASLKFSLFSVGKNASKPALTCICVEDNTIWSSDNDRLTKTQMESGIDDPNGMLIPGEAAKKLILYSPNGYYIDKSWIHFINDFNVIFSCRRVDVEYPDLEPFLKIKGSTVKLPETIIHSIERASIMSVDDFETDRFITVTATGGKILIKGKGPLGSIEESLKVEFDDEFAFNIHPQHFIEILQLMNELTVSEKGNSILFKGKKFSHVISLI